MGIESRLLNNDTELLIHVSGRFDFTVANDFLNSYRNLPVKDKYILDLANVEFMDSAAIGMILLLREFTKNQSVIRISHCSDEIKKVIQMSHIDRFVEIAA